MPVHQFPTSSTLQPRPARDVEQPMLIRPQTSRQNPTRFAVPRRDPTIPYSTPETHLDPPPAYNEPRTDETDRAHTFPFRHRDKGARKGRKLSWDLVGKVEDRYWQLTTADNVYLRWSLEIFSWTLSAICMAVIILLLLLVGGKKEPSWPVNSYISVISRLATSALLLPTTEALGQIKWYHFSRGDTAGKKRMWDFEMIDSASRGPFGSLILLLRMKGSRLAAFGAAVILLAVGLDPFFQQVVDLPQRLVLHSHNATIPRVLVWHSDKSTDTRNGSNVYIADQNLQTPLENFFFDSQPAQTILDNGGTSAAVPLICPTSNCTWPQYETLSVCSECKDVSDLLTYDCLDTPMDWVSNVTKPQAVAFTDPWPRSQACGYFLNATSDTPMLMSGYSVDASDGTGEALLMRLLGLSNYLKFDSWYGGSIHFRDRVDLLADFVVVGIDGSPASIYTHKPKVTAHECALTWCTRSMVSEYRGGKYTEQITRTFQNTTNVLGSVPYQFNITSSAYGGYKSHYSHNIRIAPPYLEANESFGLSNTTAMTAEMNFWEILPSYWTMVNSTAEPRMRTGNILQAIPSLRTMQNSPWLAPRNISQEMETLCTTLTNTMRSTSSTETVFGDAFDNETYVQVNWAWMTLPLIVLLGSLIFLVFTVRSSSQCDQIWKNSAVATLMHALPEDVKQQLQDARGNPHMLANRLNIQLTPDSTGWRMSVAMEDGSSMSSRF